MKWIELEQTFADERMRGFWDTDHISGIDFQEPNVVVVHFLGVFVHPSGEQFQRSGFRITSPSSIERLRHLVENDPNKWISTRGTPGWLGEFFANLNAAYAVTLFSGLPSYAHINLANGSVSKVYDPPSLEIVKRFLET